MDKVGMPQSKDVVGLRTVYLLWHTDSCGDEKLVGVYATRRLAHLYVFCKGGDGEVGGHSFFLKKGAVRINQGGEAKTPDASSMSPHLCQNRKGAPATMACRGSRRK